MKCVLSILVTFIAIISAYAQAPQLLNYQTVVRNSGGQPVSQGTHVSFRFTIHEGSEAGTPVFVERQTGIAGQSGLVVLKIGAVGNLAVVDWANGTKYLQVEADSAGGTNFVNMGTSQLASVPYALFAANSANGPSGATGVQGSTGIVGSTGAPGINGGPDGPAGATGITGANGSDTGTTGPLGPQGTQGLAGATGSNGLAGNTGATGATGASGPSGAAGATGLSHYIAELYAGGIVIAVWKDSSVEHGMVASLTDVSQSSVWSDAYPQAQLSGPDRSFYQGEVNTAAMLVQPNITTGGAVLCTNYRGGGYADWYLPSIWELGQCYLVAGIINKVLGGNNGFQPAYYWSSTNDGIPDAIAWSFFDGTSLFLQKTYTANVRAVRRY